MELIHSKEQPYGYIRVSSEKQSDFGYSLDSQKNSILNYCRLFNLPEPIFIYDEGLSGREIDKRDGIKELLEKVETGVIKFIITVNLSRMFRNVIDTLQFIDTIDTKAIDFVSITEKYDTTTAMGKLHITI